VTAEEAGSLSGWLPAHADAGIGNTPLIGALTLLNLLGFCLGLRPIAGLAGGSGRGPAGRRGPSGMPHFSLLSHAFAVTRQGVQQWLGSDCDQILEIKMATGKVKWFNPTKGYGFIQPSGGGQDVFVHISAVERAGLSTLNENQDVEFEIVSNRGKSSAENLKVK
jgi:CspA family cold shock protein